MDRSHRGIPLVGMGPSVINGTDPVQALLSKERRRGLTFAFDVQVKIPSDLPPMPPRKRTLPKGRRVSAPNGRFF